MLFKKLKKKLNIKFEKLKNNNNNKNRKNLIKKNLNLKI